MRRPYPGSPEDGGPRTCVRSLTPNRPETTNVADGRAVSRPMKVRSVLIGAAVAIAATLALSTGAQARTVDLGRAQTTIRIDGQAAGDTPGGAVPNARDG